MKPVLNSKTRSSWIFKKIGLFRCWSSQYGRETEGTYRLSTAIRGTSIVQSHTRHLTLLIDNTQFSKIYGGMVCDQCNKNFIDNNENFIIPF